MTSDMWNMVKPLEVEYRQLICQSSDKSNSNIIKKKKKKKKERERSNLATKR